MDLYGDLPPAVMGEEGKEIGEVDASWAAAAARAPTARKTTVTTAVASATATAAGSNAAKPKIIFALGSNAATSKVGQSSASVEAPRSTASATTSAATMKPMMFKPRQTAVPRSVPAVATSTTLTAAVASGTVPAMASTTLAVKRSLASSQTLPSSSSSPPPPFEDTSQSTSASHVERVDKEQNLQSDIKSTVPLAAAEIQPEATTQHQSKQQHQQQEPEPEPEPEPESEYEHVIVNFECDDAYDPHRPNDYTILCEERKEAERLQQLAEDNKQLLLEQQREREQRENERAAAVQKGDVQKLATMMPMGRGRGRNMLNLPSWMTEKPELSSSITGIPSSATNPFGSGNQTTAVTSDLIETGAKVAESSGESFPKRAAVAIKPSTVLLIVNMVAPGDVDDSLVSETAAECAKYGIVLGCKVNECKDENCPENERVRTFVHFQKKESAIAAYRDLNGRYFGGRQITAKFHDENKFLSDDLWR